MKSRHILHIFKVILIAFVACTVVGQVVSHLWNWLMPPIFGLTTITFWQALGLFVLGKLLFGGFHRHGGRGKFGGGPGGPWGRQWRDRMEQMTPEERERFRSRFRGGMHGRRGWCAPEETPTAPTV